MGSICNVLNELRGRLGPHEAVRVDCGAVALRAWRVSTHITAKIEPIVPSGAAVASPRPSLRVSWRRVDPLLPVANTRGSSGISRGLTDAPTTEKCIEKSRRLRAVAGLRPSVRCLERSSPVAGGPTKYALQLAVRPKAPSAAKNGKITK